ncbi:MAG: DUF5694 domain-containing protein [Bacteroidota bacterium]
MNHRYFLITLSLVFIFFNACQSTKDVSEISSPIEKEFDAYLPEVTPVKIAYLGSYHMSNPGADQFNLESDDVLAPKRQVEIQEVVDLLKAFNPTKIALESPFKDSLTLARYKGYVKGEIELRRSEEEQIGFRLAKMLGHETVYPIDFKMNLNSSGLEGVIEQDPQKFGPLMGQLETAGNGAMTIMDKWLKNGTIREMLYNMNDPAMEDVALSMYFQFFVPIVKDDNYVGADMVNTWYHRNIRIFSNLHKISDSTEDRILVVYGQGHIPILKHFTEMSPYFEMVDVRQFLEK